MRTCRSSQLPDQLGLDELGVGQVGWFDRLPRSAHRKRVERETDTLITFLGEMAYDEARDRARVCRNKGDDAGDRLWSKVAVTIAKRTGREIGVKIEDRIERPRPRATLVTSLARNVQAIHHAMARIARSDGDDADLHNVRVYVLRSLDLVDPSPAAQAAGDEVCRAAAGLAGDGGEFQASVAQGVYPALLEAAGAAVERFREAVLRSALGSAECSGPALNAPSLPVIHSWPRW